MMEKLRQKENRWVRRLAQVLLVLNLVGAVGFYFAAPVYHAMFLRQHPEHSDVVLWMTLGVREFLFVLNCVAALLVIKRYFYFGLAILFATGTAVFVHAVQVQANIVQAFLFSYWDVMGLWALDALYRWRSQPGKVQ